jgi:formimidoylglutamate deiminase
MTRAQILEADLTWTGAAFESGVQVRVDDEGRIALVGRLDQRPTLRLRDRALLPGFVNAHSHAFQRGLRGRGETFPRGSGSFWTWREAMYELVEGLDAQAFYRWSLQAFREMRAAGITSVGEFHYLHHSPGVESDFALDELVLKAAARAGVRLVLLQAYYASGGIGRPLTGAQLRFRVPSPAAYWERIERLAEALQPRTQSLGAVAHSVRAAPPDEIAALYAESRRRGLPFHIHVAEHPQEVDECRAAYGLPPLVLLLERLGSAQAVTAVHCTHSEPEEIERFFAGGGRLCVCPLTEASLGDGLPTLGAGAAARGLLCLGTDSNSRISPAEEMRWLEYGQRLRARERGVLRDGAGRVAPALLRAATLGGAGALGLDAGAIAPGAWADLVAVDLNAPALAGWDAATLVEALVFGAGDEVVAATCVGGDWMEHRDGGQGP